MFGALKRIFCKPAPQATVFSAREGTTFTRKSAETADRVIVPLPETAGSAYADQELIKVSYSGILKALPQELHGKINPPASAKFSYPTCLVLEQLPKGAVKIPFGELRKSSPVGFFRNSSDQDSRSVDLPLREILPQIKRDAYARRSQQQRQEVSDEITDLFGQKGELLAKLRVLQKDELKPSVAAKAPAVQNPAPTPPVEPAPTPEASPIKLSAPLPEPKAKSPAPAIKPISMPTKPVAPVKPAAAPAKSSPLPASTPRVAGKTEALIVPLGDLSKFWPDPINQEIVELGLEGAECALHVSQLGKCVHNGAVRLTWAQLRSWIRPALPEDSQSPHGDTVVEIPLKTIASLTLAHGQKSTPLANKKAATLPKLPAMQAPPKSEPVAIKPEPVAVKSGPVAKTPPAAPKTENTRYAKAGLVSSAGGKQYLRLPLSLIWNDWPEALRGELEGSEYANSVVELPRDTVEPGLKSGKVEFLWKDLQEFLKPSCNGGLAPNFFDNKLSLPLGVLVPLLFSTKGATTPKRAFAADSIPDVFNAAGKVIPPAEETPAPAAAQPVTAPEPAAQPAPQAPKAEPKDLAELFGEPDKRNWTPNEIVHKTTLLPDVRGALIALQDGLLVASCMPPEWKTETIAAFLPQIFGRMTQYAKELKMGDLNCVTFTVEHGTLQIYNAGIIYFAALGLPGQTMPSSLNLIARELSRHTR
jgi:predicted regulator of Ras-like GTPase activity (Roadblock/LC7/MglB family)